MPMHDVVLDESRHRGVSFTRSVGHPDPWFALNYGWETPAERARLLGPEGV